MSAASEAFSATDRINNGDWDRFLLHLKLAIAHRMRTNEFKNNATVGDE